MSLVNQFKQGTAMTKSEILAQHGKQPIIFDIAVNIQNLDVAMVTTFSTDLGLTVIDETQGEIPNTLEALHSFYNKMVSDVYCGNGCMSVVISVGNNKAVRTIECD